jgi:hypothetical protein
LLGVVGEPLSSYTMSPIQRAVTTSKTFRSDFSTRQDDFNQQRDPGTDDEATSPSPTRRKKANTRRRRRTRRRKEEE